MTTVADVLRRPSFQMMRKQESGGARAVGLLEDDHILQTIKTSGDKLEIINY